MEMAKENAISKAGNSLELQEVPEKTIEERIDSWVNDLFDERVVEICDPAYYKNQYLQYAFANHASYQCICRTYLELLKSGYQYTHDPLDLKHLNLSLKRLLMVSDKELISFLNQTIEELKEEIHQEYQYIIADIPGRIKSFKSAETKIRTKLLKEMIYKEMLGEVSKASFSDTKVFLFQYFSRETESKFLEEKASAINHLQKRIQQNANSVISDTFGARVIIYSYNRCRDEENLREFALELAEFVCLFFEKRGAEILGINNYISFPKENGYQSLHIKTMFAFMGIDLEIQIRTEQMHKHAEHGPASHDDYKDTVIQNFMHDFLYKISGSDVDMNEKMGLLKEQTLNPTLCCFTPQSEIPQTPQQIQPFEDPAFLEKIFAEKK